MPTEVLTTAEIADASPDWGSSGFANAELADDTAAALRKLGYDCDAEVIESMGIAAMVTLAVNAKSVLKGEALSIEAKQKVIQDGVVAASVAGLVQLII